MYGKDIGQRISERECPSCLRMVKDGKSGGWCFQCFEQWYDGDLSHENGDNLDPVKVANHVRRKNKLPPLTKEQVAALAARMNKAPAPG